jgi:hypothetical protein
VGDVDATLAEVGRELLGGPLEEYVARRKVVARRVRDAGERDAAKAIEGLGKPTVVMFAALRAADDPKAVRAAVDATAEVARVQTGSGDRAALARASAVRRELIDELVEAGLAAAGGGGGPGRADEVRAAVDLLTRHDEVLDTWLAGTLRELPQSDAGFGSLGLASVVADTGPAPTGSRKAEGASGARSPGVPAGTRAAKAAEPAAPTAAQRRAREKVEKAVEAAEAALSGADAALEKADAAAIEARAAVANAEESLRTAEAAAQKAQRAADDALERRDAAAQDLDERRVALVELETG